MICVLFDDSHSDRCAVIIHCDLICVSLMISNVGGKFIIDSVFQLFFFYITDLNKRFIFLSVRGEHGYDYKFLLNEGFVNLLRHNFPIFYINHVRL